ncbi:cyclic GMP-AMP synthase-like receptor isoform X2 [Watersipora subatra]|uniref:cyclic GMP-AMP synthase-like receptor isoform X2 n=1 Tax=Watersipora subatra TaxID=2589382 RepID=UPI00355B48D7
MCLKLCIASAWIIFVFINGTLATGKYSKPDIQGECKVEGDCPSGEYNSVLGKELRRIEEKYLRSSLSNDQKKKPEVVSHITQTLILPCLEAYRSDVAYMGSSYEFTTLPGKSDYDIQFFLKVPKTKKNGNKISSAVAEKSDNPAWRLVKGGPSKLLDEKGYLSTAKSEMDKCLLAEKDNMEFAGSPVIVKRSTSGPATTLNLKWRQEQLDIDIVVCLKAEDISNSGGLDLVGKPYSDESVAHGGEYWRLSYSRKELAKLREYYKHDERKITLFRIMKALKHKHSQLKYFPSYFYKNVLFKLVEDNPAASWDRVSLPDRFMEMIRIISEAVDTKTLYLHFNKEVNYLANKDEGKLTQVANFLKRIIRKNKYIELLQTI